MGKRPIKQTDRENRLEKRIAIAILIAFGILFILLSGRVSAQESYPQFIVEDTHVTVNNDTLWVMTHNQYMNCVLNTGSLMNAYAVIDNLKLNAIDQDSISCMLKDDLDNLGHDYAELTYMYTYQEDRKRRWRTATFVILGVAVMETMITIFK